MYEAEAELEQLLRRVDRQVGSRGEAMLGQIMQAISDTWTYNRPFLQAAAQKVRELRQIGMPLPRAVATAGRELGRQMLGSLSVGRDSSVPTQRSPTLPEPPPRSARRSTPPPPPSSPPPSRGPTGTLRSPGVQPPSRRRPGQREGEAELSRILRQVDRVAAEAEFEAGLRF